MGTASTNPRYVHHRLDVASLAGDPCAGLLFNLIVTYWRVRSKKPNSKVYGGITKLIYVRDGHWWIVKHAADWMTETGLTERRYKSALSKLKKKGLILTRTARTWLEKSTLLRLTDKAVQSLPDDLSMTWLRVPTAEQLESWWVEAHHDGGLHTPNPWTKKEIREADDLFGKYPLAQTRSMIEFTVSNWNNLYQGILDYGKDTTWYIEENWIDHPSMEAIYKFDDAHFSWLGENEILLPVDTWCEGGEADIGKKH